MSCARLAARPCRSSRSPARMTLARRSSSPSPSAPGSSSSAPSWPPTSGCSRWSGPARPPSSWAGRRASGTSDPVSRCAPTAEARVQVGPIGRLGRWTATHFRTVVVVWVVDRRRARRLRAARRARALGCRMGGNRLRVGRCPRGDRPRVRRPGRVRAHGRRPPARRPRLRDVARRRGSSRPTTRLHRSPPPQRLQGRPHTAIVTGRRGGEPDRDGARRRRPEGRARGALRRPASSVSLTGAPGMWSDFNEANKTAMLKSELFSWPVTLAILLLAFGSLVAAGLPLLLTILGLVASAGSLFLVTQAVRRLDLGDELRAHVRARTRDRLRALHRRPLPRRATSARDSRRAMRSR